MLCGTIKLLISDAPANPPDETGLPIPTILKDRSPTRPLRARPAAMPASRVRHVTESPPLPSTRSFTPPPSLHLLPSPIGATPLVLPVLGWRVVPFASTIACTASLETPTGLPFAHPTTPASTPPPPPALGRSRSILDGEIPEPDERKAPGSPPTRPLLFVGVEWLLLLLLLLLLTPPPPPPPPPSPPTHPPPPKGTTVDLQVDPGEESTDKGMLLSRRACSVTRKRELVKRCCRSSLSRSRRGNRSH